MNTSKWLVVAGFLFLVILFVGLLFWPFILDQIIAPVSMVVWVLLRTFVLSIDQKYYWVAIIFFTALLLYRHLAPSSHPDVQPEEPQDLFAAMGNISEWRNSFVLIDRHIQDDQILKEKLARLLVLLYAIKRHTPADFRLYDALQQGEIPVPERIRAVLFSEELRPARHTLKKLAQSIGNIPRKYIRRWTGRATAEHYRILDEILTFMEASLEMKNDDGNYTPHQH